MTALEALLVSARRLPFGAWLGFQLLATLLACVCFFRLTRTSPKLRLPFLLALPFGVLGALALGALFRFIDHVAFGGPGDFTGFSAFGVFIGVSLSFVHFARRSGADPWHALDRLAPSLLVMLGVGRVGCFAAGCDAGGVSSLPWAVRFPAGSQVFRWHVAEGLVLPGDHLSLSVHPSQLYEVLLVLPAAYLLGVSLRKRDTRGRIFFCATLTYSTVRALVDGLREGPWGMNYGQWAAVSLMVVLLFVPWPAASGVSRGLAPLRRSPR